MDKAKRDRAALIGSHYDAHTDPECTIKYASDSHHCSLCDEFRGLLVMSYEESIRNLSSRISPLTGRKQNRRYRDAIRGLRRDIATIKKEGV